MKKFLLLFLLLPALASAETRDSVIKASNCDNIYLKSYFPRGYGSSALMTYIPLDKYQEGTYGGNLPLSNSLSVDYFFESSGEELNLAVAYNQELYRFFKNKNNKVVNAVYHVQYYFAVGSDSASETVNVTINYNYKGKAKTKTIDVTDAGYSISCSKK